MRITVLFLSVLALAEADTICNGHPQFWPFPCVCSGTCTADDVKCPPTQPGANMTPGCLCFGSVISGCHGDVDSHNSLGGTIPTGFGELADWMTESLTIAENQLSGTIPDDFGLLTNLKALSIYSTALSGTLPASLGNLDQLTHCNLSGNWSCPSSTTFCRTPSRDLELSSSRWGASASYKGVPPAAPS